MKGFTYSILVAVLLMPASWGQEKPAPVPPPIIDILVRYTPVEGGAPLFARISKHITWGSATLPLRLPDGSLWIVELDFDNDNPQQLYLELRDTSIMVPSSNEARPLLLTAMSTTCAFDGKPQKIFEWNEGLVELELTQTENQSQ